MGDVIEGDKDIGDNIINALLSCKKIVQQSGSLDKQLKKLPSQAERNSYLLFAHS